MTEGKKKKFTYAEKEKRVVGWGSRGRRQQFSKKAAVRGAATIFVPTTKEPTPKKTLDRKRRVEEKKKPMGRGKGGSIADQGGTTGGFAKTTRSLEPDHQGSLPHVQRPEKVP